MTPIKEINEQLKTAKHPVARVLHKGDNFKVLVISFKKRMTLKDHHGSLPSKRCVPARVSQRDTSQEYNRKSWTLFCNSYYAIDGCGFRQEY